jgi:hypothetical protein
VSVHFSYKHSQSRTLGRLKSSFARENRSATGETSLAKGWITVARHLPATCVNAEVCVVVHRMQVESAQGLAAAGVSYKTLNKLKEHGISRE